MNRNNNKYDQAARMAVPNKPDRIPVGAGEACDLLTLLFKIKIKRSQASPAPTGAAIRLAINY
jgi:hypothetical protein